MCYRFVRDQLFGENEEAGELDAALDNALWKLRISQQAPDYKRFGHILNSGIFIFEHSSADPSLVQFRKDEARAAFSQKLIYMENFMALDLTAQKKLIDMTLGNRQIEVARILLKPEELYHGLSILEVMHQDYTNEPRLRPAIDYLHATACQTRAYENMRAAITRPTPAVVVNDKNTMALISVAKLVHSALKKAHIPDSRYAPDRRLREIAKHPRDFMYMRQCIKEILSAPPSLDAVQESAEMLPPSIPAYLKNPAARTRYVNGFGKVGRKLG